MNEIKQKLTSLIESNSDAQLRSEIDSLNWNDLNQKEMDELVVFLIHYTFQGKEDIILSTILNYILELDEDDEYRLPITSSIFLSRELLDEELRFTIQAMGLTAPTCYMGLIGWDSKEDLNYAAHRMINCFPSIQYDTWKGLYALIEQQEQVSTGFNEVLKNFIRLRLKTTSPVVKIPGHVIVLDEEELVSIEDLAEEMAHKTQFQVNDVLPSVEQAVNLIREVIKGQEENFDTSIDEMLKLIAQDYESANSRKKYLMLYPFVKNQSRYALKDDLDLFQVFGPCNTMIKQDLTIDNDQCSLYGGCRMLLCNHMAPIEDYQEVDLMERYDRPDLLDWFLGTCDKCHNKIKFRHYAVRRPLIAGSWKGCYCSWTCVLNDLVNVNPIERELVLMVMKEVLLNGIMDRIGEVTLLAEDTIHFPVIIKSRLEEQEEEEEPQESNNLLSS